MSQAKTAIADGTGAQVLAELTSAFSAAQSWQFGSTDPYTAGYNVNAGTWWMDQGNMLVKQRNITNNAWITKGKINADGTISLYDDLGRIISQTYATNEFLENQLTITYVSPTSFTVSGDLTGVFTANRKVKIYLSTSTAISYVASSAYDTVTTVTLGSAVLDATVTAVKFSIVQYGEREDTVHTSDIQQYLLNNIKRNTLYSVGDIAYSVNLKSHLRLECVSNGATTNTEPTWPTSAGIMILDGGTKWITDDIRDGTPVGRVVGDIMLRTGYVKANGATVNRADYPRLYNFANDNALFYNGLSITGTTTSGSKTVSGVSTADIANLSAGMLISGTGIPTGATVVSISTSSFVISAAATASGTITIIYGNATNFPGFFGKGDGSTTMVLPNWVDRMIQMSSGIAGQAQSAGLPNIQGQFLSTLYHARLGDLSAYYTGATSISTSFTTVPDGNANGTDFYYYLSQFDASKSNSIYGAAPTVQPAAINLIPQIKY